MIYVPSYDGSLYAIHRKTGNTVWKFDSGGSKEVLIEGSRIYLPASDGTIHAIDLESGKLVWKFDLDGGTPTKIVTSENHLIFGSSHRYLYVLHKSSGRAVYRYDVGFDSGFWGAPAFDPVLNKLYILSGAGNLMAFTLRKARAKVLPHGSFDPYVFDGLTESGLKL